MDNNEFSLLGDFSFGSKPVAPPAADPNEAVFDPLAELASPAQEAPPQNSNSAVFDPFAQYAVPQKPQPATQTPPQVRSNPFAPPTEIAEPAPVAANPQPVALPRRKPPASTTSSFGLPPPPTKQSVKASQWQTQMGGKPSPVAPNLAPPAPQPPASEGMISINPQGNEVCLCWLPRDKQNQLFWLSQQNTHVLTLKYIEFKHPP